MICYAAPMEGITGYRYRNAHHRYFPGINKYFTPFITPKIKRGLTKREQSDILPENNQGIPLVPQILTRNPEDFLSLAGRLKKEYGYDEVNLNLGCPSGTVVSKGKGSGFLADPEGLRHFFDVIFSKDTGIRISVKTRLGMKDPGEILSLMAIYNDFPIHELIIHARVREDRYKRPVNRDAFREALAVSRLRICYNGDLFSPADCRSFGNLFPEVDRVMLGRGLIARPSLAMEIHGGKRELDREEAFLETLCQSYEEILSGEKNVLFKMKEIWSYMADLFSEGNRVGKKIKKASCLREYRMLVRDLFEAERERL